MSFAELLEAALDGTLRRDPPAVVPALAARPKEGRLLAGASLEGLRRLAGRPLAAVDESSQPLTAAAELLDEIPPAAARRLIEIVERRPEHLPEWLTLAAELGLRVPHELLPDLLGRAALYVGGDNDVSDLVVQVGGARLAWLAAQRPAWAFALAGSAEPQRAAAARRSPVGWSEEESRAFLQQLPALLKEWSSSTLTVLRDAQLRLDPIVADDVERMLQSDTLPGQGWVVPSIERLAQVLGYRALMRREVERA